MLSQAYDPETFRRLAHNLVDEIAKYLTCAQNKEIKAIDWAPPAQRLAEWRARLDGKTSFQELTQAYLANANHLHHPGYVGHQVAPVLPLAGLTELLTGVLNTGLAVYEMSPAGTSLEILCIEWLLKVAGFREGNGFLTSGGTLGNLTALLAARNRAGDCKNAAILVSDQAHYSIERATRVLGWGPEATVAIATDENYRITLPALERAHSQAKSRGKKVIAVVASAGSTSVGAYDPLREVAAFCAREKIWLHVDGAHGASAAFSSRHRHNVDGLGEADSVIWDLHKLMLVPSLATAVLFKDKTAPYQTFAQQAAYLYHKTGQEEWYNLGHKTFECTKRDLGFRVLAVRQVYGETLFAEIIDRLYAQAQFFADLVEETPGFELAVRPQSNIVCFRFGQDDNVQDQIRAKVLEQGDFYLVRTKLRSGVFLRTTLMNPLTTVEDLKQLLSEILALAPHPTH